MNKIANLDLWSTAILTTNISVFEEETVKTCLIIWLKLMKFKNSQETICFDIFEILQMKLFEDIGLECLNKLSRMTQTPLLLFWSIFILHKRNFCVFSWEVSAGTLEKNTKFRF